MRRELAETMGTGVSVFVVGVAAAVLLDRPWTKPSQPATSLVSHLKTSPLLRELDSKPFECGTVPKAHPKQSRCLYRAGDVEVLVAWNAKTERPTSVYIKKPEAKGSTSFA